jgi:hypothetical protein
VTYAISSIGFALIFYGLSPLSGSAPLSGHVSERGCITALVGVAILAMVGCVVVLS